MKKPDLDRPFIARTRFLVIALLVGSVYSYGWRVTEIDLGELMQDFHLVKPLVSELMQPDLITREVESTSVETTFHLAGSFSTHPQKNPILDEDTARITISKPMGVIGDSLTVNGINLLPEKPGQLYWVNSIEQEFPLGAFLTNTHGKFSMEIEVPESAKGEE